MAEQLQQLFLNENIVSCTKMTSRVSLRVTASRHPKWNGCCTDNVARLSQKHQWEDSFFCPCEVIFFLLDQRPLGDSEEQEKTIPF